MIKIYEDLPNTMEDCFGRALHINQCLALIKEEESKDDNAKGKQTNQDKNKKRNCPTSRKAAHHNNKKGQFALLNTNKLQADNGLQVFWDQRT